MLDMDVVDVVDQAGPIVPVIYEEIAIFELDILFCLNVCYHGCSGVVVYTSVLPPQLYRVQDHEEEENLNTSCQPI